MSQYNHEIIYEATKEQLQDVVEDWLHRVKRIDPEMHEDLECDLYEKVRGKHFDRDRYDRAMDSRYTYDVSKRGPKWTVEQVSDYARRNGDRFDKYNEYDLAYEMNSIYDDYGNSLGENAETYYRMARSKLEEDGRAWRDSRAVSYDRQRRDSRGRYAKDIYGRR